MAKPNTMVLIVFGALIATLVLGQAPLTNLGIRDGSKSTDNFNYNITAEVLKDDATKIALTLTFDTANTDKASRPLKLSFRKFMDSGSLYTSTIFTETGVPEGENPKMIVGVYTLNVTGLKNESTYGACLNYSSSDKDVKIVYLCHLEVKAYYGGEYLLSALEIKLGSDDKFKAVRHIPVYDKPTDKLTTGGYSQIISKLSGNLYVEPSEMCAYPNNQTIRDDKPLKVLVRNWGSGSNVEEARKWVNSTYSGNATHIKFVQVTCAAVGTAPAFSKWVSLNHKIGKVSPIPAAKAENRENTLCLEFDLVYYKMQNELQYRVNCTSAAFKFVLGDEKTTFLTPPLTTTSRPIIAIQPKRASSGWGPLGLIMVGSLTIFLILLVVFVILYFRNKNKAQGYEESLAKPLNESSPYYELKSN